MSTPRSRGRISEIVRGVWNVKWACRHFVAMVTQIL